MGSVCTVLKTSSEIAKQAKKEKMCFVRVTDKE